MATAARIAVILVALVLAAGSARPVQSAAGPQAAGSAGGDPPGTCGAACAHYFDCRGVADPEPRDRCVKGCDERAPPPEQLAAYTTMDCESAVRLVEDNRALGEPSP